MGLASSVLLVNGLFGDAEREGDELPGRVGIPRSPHSNCFDTVEFLAEFCDRVESLDGVIGIGGCGEGVDADVVHVVNRS
jgi:hypothetical protein